MLAPPSNLLPTLLDAMPIGVVVLDADAKVVHFNRYEEQLSGRSRDRVLGRSFFADVAPCMNIRELSGWFVNGIGRRPLTRDLALSFDFPHLGRVREVIVRLRDLEVGARCYGALIIEDRSQEAALSQLRERLASLAVHDLKSPLTAMGLGFEMIREAAGDDPETIRELAGDGLDAARHMQGIVHDLLEVSRLRTAKMPLDCCELDVSQLVNSALAGARHAAGKRTLRAVVGDRVSTATVDGRLVRRAIDNLLSNALRFARSEVVCRACLDGNTLVISVFDDGPGVAAQHRKSIFAPFAQGGVARSSANQGLGLSLVQMVAETHGGRAEVGMGPLGGACFSLRIPVDGPPDHLTERARYSLL